ncbi:MAG: carbohydrate kinase family protein [Ignavibacteriales bacterium]|nr:carbohydrate kinase family protein [Ignavibacteriales bacterium]
MKFTIIGHICKDFIHPKKNGKTENVEPLWGGIYFAILTLAHLTASDDTIIPVFSVGEKDYDELIEILKKYPNVETSGIYKMKEETNSVHLSYSTTQTRIECSANIAPPIPFKKIQPFLKTDAFLVNMISGFDITLETLDYIRMETRDRDIVSHIDFHSLTLGVNDDFTRFRTPLMEWRRWAFMINSVQMNQTEAKSLTLERFDEDTLAKQLLSLDVQRLIITKGGKGITLYSIDEHKNISNRDFAPKEKLKTIDATGCGDVFSAAFLYYFTKTKNAFSASENAITIAGANSQYLGSSEIEKLSEYRVKIEEGIV